ncbi:MAG TPA: hypothetical protein VK420_10155 [Longimicrobium sp.]|nr:hypothetical protein [Longimicrobium sp.]
MKSDSPGTVTLGGRKVSLLVAALLAQEADRLGTLLSEVGDVASPRRRPTHVVLAGYRLTIATAAEIAATADAAGLQPARVIETIVEEHVAALERKARTRTRKRPRDGGRG